MKYKPKQVTGDICVRCNQPETKHEWHCTQCGELAEQDICTCCDTPHSMPTRRLCTCVNTCYGLFCPAEIRTIDENEFMKIQKLFIETASWRLIGDWELAEAKRLWEARSLATS